MHAHMGSSIAFLVTDKQCMLNVKLHFRQQSVEVGDGEQVHWAHLKYKYLDSI